MISFSNVHKTYRSGVDALRGIDFTIEDGEFVFVIGKSGSGKSTLMKCITREEVPTEGCVRIDGFDISSMSRALVPTLRRQLGMIYQDFRLIETKTVFENISFAGEIIGIPRDSLNRTVQLVMNVVGLKDKADAYPQELSGGEQQRVAIARAMINNPKIIVADEPTGNLDPETSESIMALLLDINKSGSTVVVCTHDATLVDRMKKRVIEIEDGLIVRDQKDSKYAETGAPAASAKQMPRGIAFGDDPAFEDDREYSDNFDDDAYKIPEEILRKESDLLVFGDSAAVPTVPAAAEVTDLSELTEEEVPDAMPLFPDEEAGDEASDIPADAAPEGDLITFEEDDMSAPEETASEEKEDVPVPEKLTQEEAGEEPSEEVVMPQDVLFDDGPAKEEPAGEEETPDEPEEPAEEIKERPVYDIDLDIQEDDE